MRKDVLGGLLVGGAIVLFVGVSVLRSHREDAVYQEWAREQNRAVFDQSAQKRIEDRAAAKKEKEEKDDFYQRLSDGLPVRMLVVGDAFAGGFGARSASSSWSKLLETELRLKYKVSVTLDDLSLGGANGIFGAYSSVMSMPTAAAPYDVCLISAGMTDDPATFPYLYEGLLRGLRARFPHCNVIEIEGLQGSLAPDTGYLDENMEAIIKLGAQYHVDRFNVPAEMGYSEKDTDAFSKYTDNGLYLNNAGQKVMSSLLFDFIAKRASAYQGYKDGDIALVYPEAAGLSQYAYFPAEDFSRLDDFNLSLSASKLVGKDGKALSGMFGVDYTVLNGKNDLYMSTGVATNSRNPATGIDTDATNLNDSLGDGSNESNTHDVMDAENGIAVQPNTAIGRITIQSDATDPEESIRIVNNGFAGDSYLLLTFLSKAQADAFSGLIVCGEIPLPQAYSDFEKVSIIGPVHDDGTPYALDKDGLPVNADGQRVTLPGMKIAEWLTSGNAPDGSASGGEASGNSNADTAGDGASDDDNSAVSNTKQTTPDGSSTSAEKATKISAETIQTSNAEKNSHTTEGQRQDAGDSGAGNNTRESVSSTANNSPSGHYNTPVGSGNENSGTSSQETTATETAASETTAKETTAKETASSAAESSASNETAAATKKSSAEKAAEANSSVKPTSADETTDAHGPGHETTAAETTTENAGPGM
ncbi:MAG: hypothetical protein SPL71_15920 [Oribacterium sp.]|nr:hypothetical protein [Oribacterium sp.]